MRSVLTAVKRRVLPADARFLPIVAGPMRGGVFYAPPSVSLRKVLGLYEHVLNPWLGQALDRADLIVDVGANDGYFTFGCAAAMRKRERPVKVLAFEPAEYCLRALREAVGRAAYSSDEITIVPKLVGAITDSDHVSLDSFVEQRAASKTPLIKIDVEGAELEVLDGAGRWLTPGTMVLIEVHKREFLSEISRRLTDVIGPLDQIDQRALPVLGREVRGDENWWLVSRL